MAITINIVIKVFTSPPRMKKTMKRRPSVVFAYTSP